MPLETAPIVTSFGTPVAKDPDHPLFQQAMELSQEAAISTAPSARTDASGIRHPLSSYADRLEAAIEEELRTKVVAAAKLGHRTVVIDPKKLTKWWLKWKATWGRTYSALDLLSGCPAMSQGEKTVFASRAAAPRIVVARTREAPATKPVNPLDKYRYYATEQDRIVSRVLDEVSRELFHKALEDVTQRLADHVSQLMESFKPPPSGNARVTLETVTPVVERLRDRYKGFEFDITSDGKLRASWHAPVTPRPGNPLDRLVPIPCRLDPPNILNIDRQPMFNPRKDFSVHDRDEVAVLTFDAQT